MLNLSSMQLDGSHAPAKNGSEHIGYQNRKAASTTNTLFFSDNNGLPRAMATPQSGNHHDVNDIQVLFDKLCLVLTEANIDLRGVFMNADSGFNAKVVREQCSKKEIEANIAVNTRNTKKEKDDYVYFDDQLYKHRFVIEWMNAWIDNFKTLLVRLETSLKTWTALHFPIFCILLSKKITSY